MAFGKKKNGETNDVVPTKNDYEDLPSTQVEDSGSYKIMKTGTKEIVNLLKENLGGEKLTANDLNRVTVPTGGNTSWQVPTLSGDKPAQAIEGIVIFHKSTRAYWKESFDESGGGSPPDCVSRDGLIGIGKPGGDCQTCPNAQFETARGGRGRGKACSESRLVYMVQPDETLPLVVKVPATSLANARKYFFGLISKGREVHSVYTKLTLAQDKNMDGIKYSKIVFEMTGDVENPNMTKAYADGLKPYLTETVEQFASEQPNDDEPMS
jgi:hypothetical protein